MTIPFKLTCQVTNLAKESASSPIHISDGIVPIKPFPYQNPVYNMYLLFDNIISTSFSHDSQ